MSIFRKIRDDYNAAMNNDPALPRDLRGALEIIFCTPGFLAITCHRINHFLHKKLRIPIIPRFLSLIVRWWTGIEIHPGAEIGSGFFIDHGAGVVIGETAEIGDNVTLYQGVTLGGTGKDKGAKRHPTLGSNVFVGSGAKILGPIKVGDNTRIGANSVVLKDVPDNSTVTGMRARIVKMDGKRVDACSSYTGTDELRSSIIRMEEEIYLLKKEIRRLKGYKEERKETPAIEIEVCHK
ncbi:MAG: serine O-acetyltransferase EpsC [Synergistaceae bacterium]|nr:serine O-acetyltransferase EpsC [Synergistaceae bacterium]